MRGWDGMVEATLMVGQMCRQDAEARVVLHAATTKAMATAFVIDKDQNQYHHIQVSLYC